MTTSNCMACIYGGSWCGDASNEPGYCYMFKEEPDGVCAQWKTSTHPQPSAVPVVRELVEAFGSLLKAYSYYFPAGNPWADKAKETITKGQQWLKECGE